MIKITSADFVISAARPAQFPTSSMAEVAFAGRSNVGKSSLLNTLVGRKALAKTSSTPGKTQQINFFLINGRHHFVDLPGYGYAQVSKMEREAWARVIEAYLTNRDQLRLVVALSDIRHETPALDRELFEWLRELGRRFVVVLTKHDKVTVSQAEQRRQEVLALLEGVEECVDVIPFSSQTRHNRDRLLKVIFDALEC
jgi:GTP-binding protein